jgi:flap endonuclease-1
MGIQGLAKLIADKCPEAIVENELKNYFGRSVAIDASMSLYQFVIAVRPDDMGQYTLTNEYGETTSHISGLFYRTIRMMVAGLKPVYVFDGKPPELKSGEIAKRRKKRAEADEALVVAEDEGDKEQIKSLNKQTVRITPQMFDDARKLLRLMGVPYIDALGEAEAQCAVLCAGQKVWATGTEDMDALTCGTPTLLRHLCFAEARKIPIHEIHLAKVLTGLDLTMDQFIDLCILLGCDYADKIKGIGPIKALEYIKKHGTIEKIIANLDKTKYQVPDNFPYVEIREYFKKPTATPAEEFDIKYNDCDEENLIKFMVDEKGFNPDKIKSGIAKLKKAKGTSVQARITNFFIQDPNKVNEKSPKKKVVKKEDNSKKRGGAPIKNSKQTPTKKAKPK